MPNARLAQLKQLLASATAPRPMLTVAAIFTGAILTTLHGRLFSMSLADLRGQFGLDVMEGAWLGTLLNAMQLVTMPVTVWFSLIFGVTRILVVSSLLLALASFLTPFARSYEALLVLHAVAGLCLGVYLPLTISLALRSLKPQFWLLAMAAYSLRVSTGMDVGVHMSGFYIGVIGWQWVYWTASVIAPAIAFMTWKAIPLTPIDRQKLHTTDWGGMAMFCLGLVLLFIGIEQGERQGWLGSGLIVSCLTGGGALLAGALMNVWLNKQAFGDLSGFSNHNVRMALLIACLFALLMTPTSVLIPNFLTQMGGLKPLQTGVASLITFGTYVVLTPIAAWMTGRIDARLMLVGGLSVITFTAWLATGISHDWRTDQFVIILMLMALGECFTLIGIIPVIVTNLNPAHGLSIAAWAPLARVLFPIVGGAMTLTLLRISSDVHHATLNAGVQSGEPLVMARAARGVSAIASIINREAQVLAYIDAFQLVFWTGLVSLLLAATLKPAPPNPITPPRKV